MPTCHRVENNLKCRYWCKRDWVFCHNNYDGYCRNDVVDYQCENGWHITEKGYRDLKLIDLFEDSWIFVVEFTSRGPPNVPRGAKSVTRRQFEFEN